MVHKKILQQGLTSEEAQRRLEKFGKNELKKPREFSEIKLFLTQFKSPLVYILVFAGLATLFLHELTDSIVIFAAVFLNTILGFYQERKAQKALAALWSLLAPKAKVIRNGEQQEIDASELVLGDLVILTIGARVPADGVLIEATDLSVNEAILTGESMPVGKKVESETSRLAGLVGRPDEIGTSEKWNKLYSSLAKRPTSEATHSSLVYMGTTVTTGIAKMMVTKTGMETEMGKIGKRVEKVEEERTPLQEQLGKLAKILAMVVGGITLMIFLFGEFLGYTPLEMFTTSVAIAVAAIPEGLVVTLTVILALGMQRILKRKAIVRKLLAAETLGSVSMICADKTGTLTEGKMRVVRAITKVSRGLHLRGVKGEEDMLVKAAVLCNDMRDPLETAMWEWAEKKLKIKNEKLKIIQEQYLRIDEIPFSPKYKYIATLHESKPSSRVQVEGKARRREGERVLFISGAPEVILNMCQVSRVRSQEWQKKFDECGQKGYRIVGFATAKGANLKHKFRKLKSAKSVENLRNLRLQWLGILIYEDPVRKGVKGALNECQKAGIEVKVVTGDYAPTAIAVLKQLDIKLDLATQIMEGEELEKILDKEFANKVSDIILFARTNPEQKLKIIQALKEKGEVVAMTGDGVNDAPALAKADIGIVVGEASDVAKETADMVLLDSNFATIVHAVEEGRTIFENIKKVVLYLLSDSFTEIILIGGSLLLRLPLPVTAAQILWVNLVEDTLPGIALAFEPEEKEIMAEPPRPRGAPILDSELKTLIFIIGVLTDLILLILFYWLLKGFLHLHYIQTVMFVALGIDSLFICLACRSLRKNIFQKSLFANKLLIYSLVLGFLLLFLAVYLPPLQTLLRTHSLGIKEWLVLFSLGVFNLLAIELTKWIFISSKARNKVLQ